MIEELVIFLVLAIAAVLLWVTSLVDK